jgi:hypothetical protein
MGPDTIVPVFGMLTGIVTTGLFFWGIVQVARGPVGQALARRIQGRHGVNADVELISEVSLLRDQVESLQQQLAETQERVDFTERLLSKGRAPESLPRS